MKDQNAALRIGYMTLLNTIGNGVNVFYEQAPDNAVHGSKYIVVRSTVNVGDDDKNSFNSKTSVVVECISVGGAVSPVTDSEFMVGAVKGLIDRVNQPNLSPDFVCITTKLTSDEQLTMNDGANKILRRVLRYEHQIGQL